MDYDPELGDNIEALETLAEMGYLDKDSPAFGIALKWLHDGEDELSTKQMAIFDKYVRPIIAKTCGVCGEGIELPGLPNVYISQRQLCSYHMYQFNKDD
ncbi:hypothetical protein [Enterovibrio norvegicus]|uniref:hypothetical protein n=1 Tax=Enterovibrio norvegicus TaxID=188144 RepID=UPI00354D5DCF